jgi:hypothetical protein
MRTAYRNWNRHKNSYSRYFVSYAYNFYLSTFRFTRYHSLITFFFLVNFFRFIHRNMVKNLSVDDIAEFFSQTALASVPCNCGFQLLCTFALKLSRMDYPTVDNSGHSLFIYILTQCLLFEMRCIFLFVVANFPHRIIATPVTTPANVHSIPSRKVFSQLVSFFCLVLCSLKQTLVACQFVYICTEV